MKIMSKMYDYRINSWNFYVNSSYGEYLTFAKNIIGNNTLQRKRVKTSKTIYSLLKNDMKKCCTIPPLTLALIQSNVIDPENPEESKLMEYIKNHSSDVLILDGLQRTLTMIEADEELQKVGGEEYRKFLNNELRLEIYAEINKFGILYRMLTLNTGQTPMSARHQLEMLYSNMLDTQVDGIKFVTDVDGKADPDENEFIFKNVIEGFNSYMNRNELPIDRQEILDNVKMLENMASENVSEDIFREFAENYIKVFTVLRKITDDHAVTDEELMEYEISESPFGKKVSKIFSSSQSMTGFGAAAGKMKDLGIIGSLSDIVDLLPELERRNEGVSWMLELLQRLDKIKSSSKKIGNAQRMLFQYFFRELFNSESDSYLNLQKAVENGYNKYYSQV